MGEKGFTNPIEGKGLFELVWNFNKDMLEHDKFKHRQDEDKKAFQQQQSTIIWVRWLGIGWLGFVICAFSLLLVSYILSLYFSLGAESGSTSFLGSTNVAIALIASGTSAAVIGPMLVAYAVFRKKSPTGSLLQSGSEMTKEDSS